MLISDSNQENEENAQQPNESALWQVPVPALKGTPIEA